MKINWVMSGPYYLASGPELVNQNLTALSQWFKIENIAPRHESKLSNSSCSRMMPLWTASFSSIVTSYLNHLNLLNKCLRFILEFLKYLAFHWSCHSLVGRRKHWGQGRLLTKQLCIGHSWLLYQFSVSWASLHINYIFWHTSFSA